MKYTEYRDKPYDKFRDFFLEHPEYTHLAICPDDLIVTKQGVDLLLNDIREYGMPVIMGICNVEPEEYLKPEGNLAMTHNLPTGYRPTCRYEFYKYKEIQNLANPIIEVPWCGTPFAIFRRDIVEKMPFLGDGRWNNGGVSYAYDVGIAHDLKEMVIPILVDTRAHFFHNRTRETMGINIHKPHCYFEKLSSISSSNSQLTTQLTSV